MFGQTFQWAERGGGTGAEEAGAAVTDRLGNTYVTGFFSGSATFGTAVISSAGFEDIYLAKYSSTGRLIWIRSYGSTGFDRGNGLALDTAAAIVYLTGAFEGTITIGNSISSAGRQDVFVARIDSAGTPLWARSGGGNTGLGDEGTGISTDAAGNAYVTGFFSGPATFSGQTLMSNSSSRDIFIARYSSAGNLDWVRAAGSSQDDRGLAIRTDSAGNSSLTGIFRGTATFDDRQVTATGTATEIFVAQYTPDGTLRWVVRAGGADTDAGQNIAFDGLGNVYVTGSFSGQAEFDGLFIQSSGSSDIFLAKYDSTGLLIWLANAGGTGDDQGLGLYVSPSGLAYVTGFFTGTASFDSRTLTSAGARDIFVARYDSSGTLLDLLRAGGTGRDEALDISLDTAGNSYLHGTFTGTTSLGSFALTAAGNSDVYTARLSPFPALEQPPLPVSFISFFVTETDQGVLAQWQTASEQDNHYFTLERSFDGSTFSRVSEVNGAGNSQDIRQYTAIDHAPAPGTSYYRIRQTDYNGHYSFSPVRAISLRQGLLRAVVFPNPVLNMCVLQLHGLEARSPVTIQLSNALGQVVWQQEYMPEQAATSIEIALSGQAAGLYHVHIRSHRNHLSLPLVKE